MEDKLILGGVEFKSRLLTGTGKFASKSLIPGMIKASECQIITMALRRVDKDSKDENVLSYITSDITLLPNTSGARTAEEAIKIARIARAAGCGDFIKIEVITDMKYLMPDNEETLKATKVLAAEGFKVLPYMTADLISAKKMELAGAAAVMPLGSPIGSNKGIQTRDMIKLIIENSNIPVIVDAGIGRPSHAAEAMEMGADAVLVNSAIACSPDPIKMAAAFRKAVEAGREAYLAELAEEQDTAYASSPFTAFLEA